MNPSGRRSIRWRGPWALAATALLLVGATCLVVGVSTAQEPGGPAAIAVPGWLDAAGPGRAGPASPAAPDVGPTDLADPETVTPGTVTSEPVAPAPAGNRVGSAGSVGRLGAVGAPTGLRIPAIDLAVPLGLLGLNADRTVEVPADFQQAGWYRFGPAPGQPGAAVILGHVDSYRGPAVFYRLRTLEAGDPIDVDTADGSTVRFIVETVRTYLKDEFPARQVYSSGGAATLNLVTCGGEFDRRSRSYLSNVVVHAAFSGTVADGGHRGR